MILSLPLDLRHQLPELVDKSHYLLVKLDGRVRELYGDVDDMQLMLEREITFYKVKSVEVVFKTTNYKQLLEFKNDRYALLKSRPWGTYKTGSNSRSKRRQDYL